MKRQKNGVWKLDDSDMNFVAIAFSEAAARLAQMGAPHISREMKKMCDEIHEALDAAGFYDECKTA